MPGTLPTDTLTPKPVATGGQMSSIPPKARSTWSSVAVERPTRRTECSSRSPRCRVLTAVGPFDAAFGHKVPR